MKKSSEFRRHAAECMALARKAKTAEEKKQLVTMAETWLTMAKVREANVDQPPVSSRKAKQ